MLKVLEKYISSKDNGLMLLDLPTGFGKTTTVIQYMKNFLLNGDRPEKKLFFVANLKTNLPDKQLKKMIGEDDYKKYCVYLKPYWQSVFENWNSERITNKEIKASEEYKNLELDVETLRKFKNDKEELKKNNDLGSSYKQIKKLIKGYENKIEKDSEVKFRQFLKQHYFYNKSTSDKEKFVTENKWLVDLYPACKLKNEESKIIICTTKKFFSPIDTFVRMPFYIYNDSLTDNTVTFIDEFDTTKETLLGQIIDDGLKVDLDIFSLFLNIYYSLLNLRFPNSLLKLSEYRKEKIANEEWTDIETLLQELKNTFKKEYVDNNLERLTKSKGFENKKAFIFDDGISLNIISDSSKKHLHSAKDESENNNCLSAIDKFYDKEDSLLYENIIKNIRRAINEFIKKTAYISKNYMDYKNQSLKGFQTRYSFEESVLTVLSAFNISKEFRQNLLDRILDKNANLKLDLPIASEYTFMRKGFQYTEIEDEYSHDLQTKSHSFSFDTTPEGIITKLALRSRVVGISATATIETVIGNYDIKYLKKILGDRYYEINPDEKEHLKDEFLKSQKKYETDNININTEIIDDFSEFSDKEKSISILKLIFEDEILEKYLQILEKQKNFYHFFILCKLGLLYKKVSMSDSIFSFLAFMNSFPITSKEAKSEQFINLDILNEMCKDIQNAYDIKNVPEIFIVRSSNFEESFINIKEKLAKGEKTFVISTYKTIGNGKNIQYTIPTIEEIEKRIIKDDSDEKNEKDFDAIYLSTPTNLIQNLRYDSDNKIKDLCNYLFQQEYLYQNSYLTYSQRRINIENGFRRVFYGDQSCTSYKRNPDILLNTAQLIIQAVGRICRCRNKNKNINLFVDKEVVSRLKIISPLIHDRIFNKEFLDLLNMEYNDKSANIETYTIINKTTFIDITNKSKTVRNSPKSVKEWQDLREYVLKNPTASFVLEKYRNYYFHFDDPYSGYSYKFGNNFNFKEIKFNEIYGLDQVSAENSELIRLMNIKNIKELFKSNGYATDFEKNNYIISQSLYKQIYKGALGEVVGKYIIEKAFDIELEELDDYSMYEFFDYKFGNIYFDLKHWDTFLIENDIYSQKVKRKLAQIKGSKAILVNIFQRGNHISKISKDETIVQIPYVINNDNDIDYKFLNNIEDLIEDVR